MRAEHWEWLVYATVGGTGLCASFLIIQMIRRARRMHDAANQEVLLTDTSSGFMRSFLPVARSLGMGLRAFLAGNRSDGLYMRLHASIGQRLSSAGNPQGINPDEYMGFGILNAIFGGIVGTFIFMLLEPGAIFSIYAYFAFGSLAGALLWRSWLARKRDQWRNSIRKALPFSLDLLTLAMEAGLDFTSALARMVTKIADTPLGKEYSLLLREVQLGKTRSQALRDFSRRVDVPDVGSVVASLIQAEELGSSLGPILRIQAGQQRERRSQRAEEMAMKAPVKILFPLVACLFPTVLIILFGPVAIYYMTN